MPPKTFKKTLIHSFFAVICLQISVAHLQAQGLKIKSIQPSTDFDQRFYYVPGQRQNVWGYRAGALINEKFKIGLGGYYMNESEETGVASDSLTRTSVDEQIQQQKIYLGTVYFEPYLIRQNLWESSLVIEAGYGRTINTATSKTAGTLINSINAAYIPAGAGLSVNLKCPRIPHFGCLRWFGINAMAGYRVTIYQQDKSFNYNGAYWSLSGAVFLDRAFEDFRNWQKQNKNRKSKRAAQLNF